MYQSRIKPVAQKQASDGDHSNQLNHANLTEDPERDKNGSDVSRKKDEDILGQKWEGSTHSWHLTQQIWAGLSVWESGRQSRRVKSKELSTMHVIAD
jgi:hypothetical protein